MLKLGFVYIAVPYDLLSLKAADLYPVLAHRHPAAQGKMFRSVCRPGVLSLNGLRMAYASQAMKDAPQVQEVGAVSSSQASTVPGRVANLCTTRGVIRLAGADVLTFLQGLVTNDVSKLAAAEATPMYAAILNVQGRLLQDLFLHRQAGPDTVLLADVHLDGIPELLRLLRRYKLRAAVDIADVSQSHAVWVNFGFGVASEAEAWAYDPRLSDLGRRAVVEGEPSSPQSAPSLYNREYRHWRIEHGIAEGPEEIPAGEAIPLEYNLDALQGISFDKGCYVGQELVARAHWSGTVRKRLMPFALHPAHAAAVGSAVEAEGVKRPVGNIRVLNGGSGRGLAMLRLQQGLAAAAGKQSLHIKEQPNQKLQPWQPTWWSSNMILPEIAAADGKRS